MILLFFVADAYINSERWVRRPQEMGKWIVLVAGFWPSY
jgi:hypothetical protein